MTTLSEIRQKSRDPRDLMNAIGVFLTGKIQGTFRSQGRGGQSWAPRSVPNKAGILADLAAGRNPPERRFQDRPAAIDTGRLRGSISYRVDGDTVTVGSTVAYASDVQRGGTKTITVDKRALDAWIRSLSGDRKTAVRRAFSAIRKAGSYTVTVPPRPFVFVTDEERRQILDMAKKFFGGST